MADDDAEIIQRVLAGRTNDYRLLVERYQSAIFRFVNSMVDDQHLAEDLTQDAFLAAFANLSYYVSSRAACSCLVTTATGPETAVVSGRFTWVTSSDMSTTFSGPPRHGLGSVFAAIERCLKLVLPSDVGRVQRGSLPTAALHAAYNWLTPYISCRDLMNHRRTRQAAAGKLRGIAMHWLHALTAPGRRGPRILESESPQ